MSIEYDERAIEEAREEYRGYARRRGEMLRHFLEQGVTWRELQPTLRWLAHWKAKSRELLGHRIMAAPVRIPVDEVDPELLAQIRARG